MSNFQKCSNPACSCVPPAKEQFCRPHCEAMKGSAEISCQCAHPSCGGAAIHA